MQARSRHGFAVCSPAPSRFATGFYLVLLAVCLACVPAGRAQQGDVRGVHDPCIIEEKGVYYVFCTGRGVPVRRSTDLIHWENAGWVFAEDVPAWALKTVPEARSLWAPDISFIDGEYRLYYSTSTFGSWLSCIGLATNRTLDPHGVGYGWVDKGLVIDSNGGPATDFNAIDPNAVTDAAGQTWLALGSFRTGIKIVKLDRRTGKPFPGEKPTPLAARPEMREQAIEGPFVVRHGGFYYLFVSFGYCCQGLRSDYRIAVGRSESVTGPYVDAAGKLMLEGGGTVILQGDNARVRAPGHCAVLQRSEGDLLVYHFIDANDRGAPHLQIRRLDWGANGFPVVGSTVNGL